MDVAAVEALEAMLHDILGDDFHGLVRCWDDDGLRYEEIFMRDDIREHYTDDDREAMARETVFRVMEEDYLESIYQLGDRRFTLEYFEHAALIILPVGAGEGLVVGLEPGEGFDHTTIALDCLEVLEG